MGLFVITLCSLALNEPEGVTVFIHIALNRELPLQYFQVGGGQAKLRGETT